MEMTIVEVDAPARYGDIWIDYLKICFSSYLGMFDIRANRMCFYTFQSILFKLVGSSVLRIDGVKADQMKVPFQLFGLNRTVQ